MATKAEGQWPGVVLGATCGADDKNNLVVRVNVKITDGPNKGVFATYEDTVNTKSSLYIQRSLRAVGWTGRLPLTESLTPDVAAWVEKTGGATTVEIKHIAIKKGKKFDKWVSDGCKPGEEPVWDKVQSLGRGPAPLAPPSQETAKDADDIMRQALKDDGIEPPANPDDLPF